MFSILVNLYLKILKIASWSRFYYFYWWIQIIKLSVTFYDLVKLTMWLLRAWEIVEGLRHFSYMWSILVDPSTHKNKPQAPRGEAPKLNNPLPTKWNGEKEKFRDKGKCKWESWCCTETWNSCTKMVLVKQRLHRDV